MPLKNYGNIMNVGSGYAVIMTQTAAEFTKGSPPQTKAKRTGKGLKAKQVHNMLVGVFGEDLHAKRVFSLSKVRSLADRGFGDQKRFQFLKELGLNFMIRFRGDIYVTSAGGERRKAKEWIHLQRRPKTDPPRVGIAIQSGT